MLSSHSLRCQLSRCRSHRRRDSLNSQRCGSGTRNDIANGRSGRSRRKSREPMQSSQLASLRRRRRSESGSSRMTRNTRGSLRLSSTAPHQVRTFPYRTSVGARISATTRPRRPWTAQRHSTTSWRTGMATLERQCARATSTASSTILRTFSSRGCRFRPCSQAKTMMQIQGKWLWQIGSPGEVSERLHGCRSFAQPRAWQQLWP
mmetsp:Transcript_7022/g.15122  ORF Transcript_7022/g.15122 Transcript_7022/m.15122 type:complete len:205 (-) Transcript_7022:146-760(-)